MAKIKRIGGYNMARQVKPVFIPGTNMQFASASAAAKALGINPGNIYSVLAGRRQTAGGYQFGYTDNRTIYIPETGRTFSDIKSAAQSVKVSPKKAVKGLEGRTGSAIGGYHFTYADASRISPPSSAGTAKAVPARSKKQNRRTKKQERIKQQRTKQQQRQERQRKKEAIRSQERAESAARHKKQEDAKRLRESIAGYNQAHEELKQYIESVNKKIEEYIKVSPSLIYYHTATPAVMGLQMYTGYVTTSSGITLFDDSLSKFALPEDLTDISKSELDKITKRMQMLYQRLKAESTRKGSSFFDMNIAEQNRTMLAFEFFKTTGHEDDMDKYAYLIWDIIDIINRSNKYPEMGSDLIFNMVSDAMQGDIDPDTLDRFIQDLDGWMQRNGSEEELEEILSEMDGTYQPKAGFSVFDDDDETGWLL